MWFQNWIKQLSWPGVIAVGLGLMLLTFAAGGADWWIARQIPWWAFGVLTVGLIFGKAVVRAMRQVRRD